MWLVIYFFLFFYSRNDQSVHFKWAKCLKMLELCNVICEKFRRKKSLKIKMKNCCVLTLVGASGVFPFWVWCELILRPMVRWRYDLCISLFCVSVSVFYFIFLWVSPLSITRTTDFQSAHGKIGPMSGVFVFVCIYTVLLTMKMIGQRSIFHKLLSLCIIDWFLIFFNT